MQEIADKMNAELGQNRVKPVIKDQYYNMAQIIEKDMSIIDIAKQAMENLDIVPIIEPIRGGTDGSKISFMGLPTPNLLQVVKTCTDVLNLFLYKQWKKL